MLVIKRVVLLWAFFLNSPCKFSEDTVHSTLFVVLFNVPVNRMVKARRTMNQTTHFSSADPESFARGGPTPLRTFFFFFLLFFLMREKEDPNSTKSGPSSARQ